MRVAAGLPAHQIMVHLQHMLQPRQVSSVSASYSVLVEVECTSIAANNKRHVVASRVEALIQTSIETASLALTMALTCCRHV